MDLGLYGRVIWRFKMLVVVGLLLALTVAILSTVRIGSDGVSYRQTELWSSQTRLGVTQNGFPWGRLLAGQATPDTTNRRGEIPIAEPGRFVDLAVLYAELATSDDVFRLIRKSGPMRGQVIATQLRSPGSGAMLPLIELMAISSSPRNAVQLARRSSAALKTYVQEEQRANHVPISDRVVLEELLQARSAAVFQPRSKTLPVVIFLALMFATVGLAFLLENLRPRHLAPLDQAEADLPRPAQRRTA
jgi:hypothetical protein